MFFHTSICGPNVVAFRHMFALAIAYAHKNQINQVALAVHAKSNLDGVIEEALGEGFIKQLKKGPVTIEGVQIGLATERLSAPFHGGVVFLAAHTATKFLLTLEKHYERKALFYVPWLGEELQDFLKRHASTEVAVSA